MNKIKKPKPKANRTPTAITEIINRIERHQEGVYFTLPYIDPPLTEEERNKCAYVASEALKALEKEYGPRARMIVPMMMHYSVMESLKNNFILQRSVAAIDGGPKWNRRKYCT